MDEDDPKKSAPLNFLETHSNGKLRYNDCRIGSNAKLWDEHSIKGATLMIHMQHAHRRTLSINIILYIHIVVRHMT